MALPTRGRVIIETTVGEVDMELWSKVRLLVRPVVLPYVCLTRPQETPKTCRNFIALAMEGYYDGVIFHRYVCDWRRERSVIDVGLTSHACRVVPNFLVQTGDRTGTGGGGESFYGGARFLFSPRLSRCDIFGPARTIRG